MEILIIQSAVIQRREVIEFIWPMYQEVGTEFEATQG